MLGSKYPHFDRGNAGVLQALMKCTLRAPELWDAMDPDGDPVKHNNADYRTDLQVATTLYSVMPNEALQHLIMKETVKEAWDKIF